MNTSGTRRNCYPTCNNRFSFGKSAPTCSGTHRWRNRNCRTTTIPPTNIYQWRIRYRTPHRPTNNSLPNSLYSPYSPCRTRTCPPGNSCKPTRRPSSMYRPDISNNCPMLQSRYMFPPDKRCTTNYPCRTRTFLRRTDNNRKRRPRVGRIPDRKPNRTTRRPSSSTPPNNCWACRSLRSNNTYLPDTTSRSWPLRPSTCPYRNSCNRTRRSPNMCRTDRSNTNTRPRWTMCPQDSWNIPSVPCLPDIRPRERNYRMICRSTVDTYRTDIAFASTRPHSQRNSPPMPRCNSTRPRRNTFPQRKSNRTTHPRRNIYRTRIALANTIPRSTHSSPPMRTCTRSCPDSAGTFPPRNSCKPTRRPSSIYRTGKSFARTGPRSARSSLPMPMCKRSCP